MRTDRNPQISGNGQHTREFSAIEDASAPDAHDVPNQTETTDPDTLQRLFKQIRELGEYLSYYLAARTDSLKLSFWNSVFAIALGALAFVSVAGLFITSSWFVLSGLAGGLSILFGNRPWLGDFVAGLLLLAGLGAGIYWAVARRARISRENTVKKYEKRQAQQQKEFGRSVADGLAVTSPEK